MNETVFPHTRGEQVPGLSLRDYFAVCAMRTLIPDMTEPVAQGQAERAINGIVKLSYAIADGMIEARRK